MILNAGIRRVVFSGDYPDPTARQMLEAAGVELVRLSEDPQEVAAPGGG